MSKKRSRRSGINKSEGKDRPYSTHWMAVRLMILFGVTLVFNFGLLAYSNSISNERQWTTFLYSVRDVAGQWMNNTYGAPVKLLNEKPNTVDVPQDLGINLGDAILRSTYIEITTDATTGNIMQRFYTDPGTAMELLQSEAMPPNTTGEVVISPVEGKGYYFFATVKNQSRESYEKFLAGDNSWEIGPALHLPGQIERAPTTESVVAKFRNEVRTKYDQKMESLNTGKKYMWYGNLMLIAIALGLAFGLFRGAIIHFVGAFIVGSIQSAGIRLVAYLDAFGKLLFGRDFGQEPAMERVYTNDTQRIQEPTPQPVRQPREETPICTVPQPIPPKYKYTKYEGHYNKLDTKHEHKLVLISQLEDKQETVPDSLKIAVEKLNTARQLKRMADSQYEQEDYPTALRNIAQAVSHLEAI